MIRAVAAALAACLLLAGCSDDEPKRDDDVIVLSPPSSGANGHTHGPGAEAETVVGDGTSPSAGGYSLVDVHLPRTSGRPGDLTFRVEDRQGRPVREYVEEQTKLLHLYVVRSDLEDFRHLHPVLGRDGTWTARVALGGPGPYRVLAEFTPGRDPEGGHVVLGRTARLPGLFQPVPPAGGPVADDGVVRVAVDEPVESGPDGRMRITVDDGNGREVALGTYLGSYAHVTGFDVDTGAFVHVHPYGEPETTDDRTRLTFHTSFDPGRYRFFVQVRVDGFLHTVPVTSTVR